MSHPGPDSGPGLPLLGMALDAIDDFYARLFRDWPEAVTRESGGCTLSFCGNPRLNGANHVFPHTPDALTHAVLDEAEVFFKTYHAVWTVIYTDAFMPGAQAVLAEREYSARWHSPLMVLDGAPHPLPPRPDTPVIRVATQDQIDDVVHVLRDAFGTNSLVSRRVVREAHIADDTIRHYLCYAGQTPVTCATTAIHANGLATIWNVGTRQAYRRMGFGATIMRGLLDDLRAAGVGRTVLLASQDGLRMYESLGYRTLARTYYMGPPPVVRAWMD